MLPLTPYGWEKPFYVCGLVGMTFSVFIYFVLSYASDDLTNTTAVSKNDGKNDSKSNSSNNNSMSKSITGSTTNSIANITNDITRTVFMSAKKFTASIITAVNRLLKRKNSEKIKNSSDVSEENKINNKMNYKVNEKINEKKDNNDENVKNFKRKLLGDSVYNINLWLLMILGILTIFVLKSMSDWTGLYLIEKCGYSIKNSTELMLWNEIGGMVATLLSGITSDTLHNKKYVTCFIFIAFCIPSIIYFPQEKENYSYGNMILQFLDGYVEKIKTQLLFISSYINFFEIFGLTEYSITMYNKIANFYYFIMLCMNKSSIDISIIKYVFDIFSGEFGRARICIFFLG